MFRNSIGKHAKLLLWSVVVVMVALAGCGAEDSTAATGGGDDHCSIGTSLACQCNDPVRDGERFCQSDGNYGACECPPLDCLTICQQNFPNGMIDQFRAADCVRCTSCGESCNCPGSSGVCNGGTCDECKISACTANECSGVLKACANNPDCVGLNECYGACLAGMGGTGGMSGNPCPSMQTNCAGTCVDTEQDSAHCGACNHSCYGASCVDGKCSAVEVATGLTEVNAIAQDATNLYWTTKKGLVQKLAKAGGGVSTLATTAFVDLAVDNAYVYWPSGSGVSRVSITGGTPEVLVPNNTGIRDQGIALSSSHIFYSHQFKTIMSVPKSGGTPTALAAVHSVMVVARNNSFIIALENTLGQVLRIPIQGGSSTVIATGVFPKDVDVDDTYAYWLDSGPGQILKTPISGGNTLVIAQQAGSPIAMTMNNGIIYWCTYNPATVWRVPATGGTAVELATGGAGCAEIVADATHVYWVNYDDGTLWKVAQ